jgi:hypothetical protein
LVNVQRRFALGLAEILGKHIAEQRPLFDGVVEGHVGMGMRVDPRAGQAEKGWFTNLHNYPKAIIILTNKEGHSSQKKALVASQDAGDYWSTQDIEIT